jgi:hypothetical protein
MTTNSQLDVAALAWSYKRLVGWFGVQLVLGLSGPLAVTVITDPSIFLIYAAARLLAALVSVGFLGYYAYRTAAALGSKVAVLWAMAMIVPLVNVLTLLALSSRANHACTRAGIEVGLLGPKNYQPATPTTR